MPINFSSWNWMVSIANLASYFFVFMLAHLFNDEIFLFFLFLIQTVLSLSLRLPGLNFSSPVFMVSVFNFLYCTWYFIFLFLTKGYDADVVSSAIRLGMLASLALTTSCLSVVFFVKSVDSVFEIKMWVGTKILYYFLLFLVVAVAFMSISTGSTSKTDLQDNLGFFHTLLLICCLFITYMMFVFSFGKLVSWSVFSLWLAPVFSIFLFLMLLTGERDLMFRFLLFAFIIFYDINNVPAKKKFILLLAAAVILLPITQALKAVFFSSDVSLSYGLASIFFGEFSSASRNLYLVLLNDGSELYPSFSLFTDLARGLLPMSGALGYDSSVSWFHNVFRPYNGLAGDSGWGLGLVVQGYLIGGAAGVFFLFFILGLLLGLSYVLRKRSVYFYVFYLIFLSSTIYCLRADVANLVSSVFKIGVLFIFVMFLINRPIFSRRSRINER